MKRSSGTATIGYRNVALDGLRGWAAFAVFVSHCILNVTGVEAWQMTVFDFKEASLPAIVGRLGYVVFAGNAFVMVFFVLSGHVLWESFARKDYRWHWRDIADYTASRLYRLMPLVMATGLLFGLASGSLLPNYDANTIASSMVLIGTRPNAVLWSLQIELVFSFVLLLGWLVVGRSAVGLWLTVPLCIASYLMLGGNFALCSVSFFLGALVPRVPGAWARSKVTLAVGLVLLLLTSLVLGRNDPVRFAQIAGAFLVVAYVRIHEPRLLTGRMALFLGTISYALYLCHPLAIRSLRGPLFALTEDPTARFAMLLIAATIVAVPMAWLLNRWVEEPAMRGRPRIERRAKV